MTLNKTMLCDVHIWKLLFILEMELHFLFHCIAKFSVHFAILLNDMEFSDYNLVVALSDPEIQAHFLFYRFAKFSLYFAVMLNDKFSDYKTFDDGVIFFFFFFSTDQND